MWLSEESPQEIQTSPLDFGQQLKFIFSTTAAPQVPNRSQSEKESLSLVPEDLNLSALELMIHWSRQTHLSFTRDETTQEIWQFLVPEEALSHKFLMHGLLAISALELASHGDKISRLHYIKTAAKHQNEALGKFQGLISQIDRDNAKAIFAFSSILVVYSFGFLPIENTDGPSMTMEHLYQVLMLCRGVEQVIASSRSSIHDSNFSSILYFTHVEYPWLLSDDSQFALHQLYEANITCGTKSASHNSEVYQEAIKTLGEALNESIQDHIPRNVVCRWAINLPQTFLECLQKREPMAMVILSFFCVVLHRLRGVWYFRGWGTSFAKLIWQTLDPEWKVLVHWSVVEVLGELPALVLE